MLYARLLIRYFMLLHHVAHIHVHVHEDGQRWPVQPGLQDYNLVICLKSCHSNLDRAISTSLVQLFLFSLSCCIHVYENGERWK